MDYMGSMKSKMKSYAKGSKMKSPLSTKKAASKSKVGPKKAIQSIAQMKTKIKSKGIY